MLRALLFRALPGDRLDGLNHELHTRRHKWQRTPLARHALNAIRRGYPSTADGAKPAPRASSSEQNQRSPRAGTTRSRPYIGDQGR